MNDAYLALADHIIFDLLDGHHSFNAMLRATSEHRIIAISHHAMVTSTTAADSQRRLLSTSTTIVDDS